MYIVIYDVTGKFVEAIMTLSEYLEQPGRIELTDTAVTCSLI